MHATASRPTTRTTALVRGLSRATGVQRALLRRVCPDLPLPLITALWAVRQHDGLRVRALAEHLRLDASVASRHAAALVDDGLLERVEDPSDRRAALLRVTPAGLDVLDRVGESVDAAWGEALAAWDDAERDALRAGLERLADDLGAWADRPAEVTA